MGHVTMRRLLFVLPLLVACGQAETPPADEPAAATPPGLTEADVSGTWTGTAMLAGTDSVIAQWTQECSNGTCRLTTQQTTDTIVSTYYIAADSVVGSTGAYADPAAGGAMVTDHWIIRINNGQLNGTGMLKLADNPDSVVARYTIAGTKNP